MSVKCLIYCSKAKPYLYKTNFVKIKDIKKGIWDKLVYEIDNNERLYLNGEKKEKLNGKIVALFDCEKVEKWFWNGWWNCYAKNNDIDIQNIDDEDFEKSCLNFGYLYNYLFENDGYAIHLSNVKVLNNPLQFEKDFIYKDYKSNELITKAPQNMCNVYDRFGNHYVLISIKPEWVAKILNGEKTIEVRKSVVNALKGLI